MRILAAYLTVVSLWSTTPLAIKWSSEGPGYLFGVTARMSIGLLLVLVMLMIMRQPMPLHRTALRCYLAVAGHVFGSMMLMYWSSQFVPSGWLAVIFGLNPMLTALLAALCLHERSLTLAKLLAYALGVTGLAVMSNTALTYSETALQGIVGVLGAAFLQAASSVAVKRIRANLLPLTQVAGGLALAVPAYWLVWWLGDGVWPKVLPTASLFSIAYLGVIATPLGFSMYFYVLHHLSATQVSLITLITPAIALFLGITANHEPVSPRLLLGAGLIMAAVLLHEIRLPARAHVQAPRMQDKQI